MDGRPPQHRFRQRRCEDHLAPVTPILLFSDSSLTMSSTTADTIAGFLGIDLGTQGLSVVLTSDEDLRVMATGESTYACIPSLPDGHFEQQSSDWVQALEKSMQQIHEQLAPKRMQVLAIGISGQMHGEVLADANGQVLAPVRIWCDARNEAEGNELTKAFRQKVAKRATCARFLWTARNQEALAAKVTHMTTPAGYLAYVLTGEWNLGIGDAAGMFPIDSKTHDYDTELLQKYDAMVKNQSIPSLSKLLPNVCRAGEPAGNVTSAGAKLLGITLDDGTAIPVASAEGDQVVSLAGSLIAEPGMASCSFGTSVCANVVADETSAFAGVSPAVDHFCAADGKPIHMVWLRNGTTFLNTMIQSYGHMLSKDDDAFASIMPQLIAAPNDCGGLLALPFLNDEPGVNVTSHTSTACIVGWTPENATPGNVAKAALLSTIFNLKLGCNVLLDQGCSLNELYLSGGLTKTPECGQILADVFDTPTILLDAAEEGCCWGAAVMAKYRYIKHKDATSTLDWPTFVESIRNRKTTMTPRRFEQQPQPVQDYQEVFERYQKLLKLESQLSKVATM